MKLLLPAAILAGALLAATFFILSRQQALTADKLCQAIVNIVQTSAAQARQPGSVSHEFYKRNPAAFERAVRAELDALPCTADVH